MKAEIETAIRQQLMPLDGPLEEEPAADGSDAPKAAGAADLVVSETGEIADTKSSKTPADKTPAGKKAAQAKAG